MRDWFENAKRELERRTKRFNLDAIDSRLDLSRLGQWADVESWRRALARAAARARARASRRKPVRKPTRKAARLNLLAFDSWVDSSLFEVGDGFKNWWSGYSSFFARFHVSGWKWLAVDASCEALTVGTAGLAVMLAFAIPAFEETNAAWRSAGNFSVTMLDRYGNEIGKRGILHSDEVPLEEIPDHLIKATLATEDRRFFDHFGIDVLGTFRAMLANVRAKDVVQGGSSISQQLAKNLFLSPERSLRRKIKEAFLAIWLESRLTKKEILKLYLDRAYLGGGAFGVEAASQFYFNKTVRNVNLAESAMMAGLFKAPSKFAPHINLPASRMRANTVLTNMVEAGFLTEGQVHGARLNPATIVDRADFYSPDWFLDWAFEEVQRVMRDSGEYVLTVRTTVDIPLQKAADAAITNTLKNFGRGKRTKQGALVSMELDGAVRAMVGGKDYGDSQFNRAAHAYRQPGSSFKPYVYLTAIQNGFTPETTVSDGPVWCGRWSPRNYSGGYRGRMSMAHALMRSINTVAVKLSLKVGRKKVLANVRKLGIMEPRASCSMALGDTGITPLSHTAGYTSFANGGLAVRPYAIEEIRNTRGDLLYSHEREGPRPKRVFKIEHVEALNSMLGLVVTSGTGRRSQLDFTTSAGKTGTSSSWRDGWFMGYTGQYATGVWFGNDNFSPTNRVTGGNLPAMAWKEYNVVAHATRNIPQIPGLPLHPAQVAEQQRLAALKRANPALGAGRSRGPKMPEATRKLLENLQGLMKDATEKPQESPAPDSRADAGTSPSRAADASGSGRPEAVLGGLGQRETRPSRRPADRF